MNIEFKFAIDEKVGFELHGEMFEGIVESATIKRKNSIIYKVCYVKRYASDDGTTHYDVCWANLKEEELTKIK